MNECIVRRMMHQTIKTTSTEHVGSRGGAVVESVRPIVGHQAFVRHLEGKAQVGQGPDDFPHEHVHALALLETGHGEQSTMK